MYAEERQKVILERARRDGRVDVTGLASEFDVTYETIRRDLTALERHGVCAGSTVARFPSSDWVSNPRSTCATPS